ncbi:glycosyltransferase family 4 protein [Candidatus Gottesmanbacteria bacterium]|nr:glycosyltransferase family 4 protein [Candidatus Gottesmanbacteria bacterium]
MRNTYKNQSFLLLAHYATFAFQDLLFDFLTGNKSRLVTKTNFPLPELPYFKKIEIQTSRAGIKNNTKTFPTVSKPPALAYAVQAIQLLWMSHFDIPKHDIVIAQDSLLAVISLIVKGFGRCKKVIYYCHGVDQSRFSVAFLNRGYQLLDYIAAKYSDYNWILSTSMLPIRKNQRIPLAKIFHVPASIPISTLKRKTKSAGNHIIYIGVLDERNGVALLPNIMKIVVQSIPDATLDIIGDGPLHNNLIEIIRSLNLDKHIRILGLKKFHEYSKTLTDYAIGLAPYRNAVDNLTSKTDPMKIRLYQAAGVPVITTKGFHFSHEIEKSGTGVTADFSPTHFSHAVISLLKDKNFLQSLRAKALAHSKKYDIYTIYRNTFSQILQ